MKTVTRSITLSPELDEFAKQQAAAAGCADLSEFFRDLLKQKRSQQIMEEAAFLERSMAGAPTLKAEDVAAVLAAQKRTRKPR